MSLLEERISNQQEILSKKEVKNPSLEYETPVGNYGADQDGDSKLKNMKVELTS